MRKLGVRLFMVFCLLSLGLPAFGGILLEDDFRTEFGQEERVMVGGKWVDNPKAGRGWVSTSVDRDARGFKGTDSVIYELAEFDPAEGSLELLMQRSSPINGMGPGDRDANTLFSFLKADNTTAFSIYVKWGRSEDEETELEFYQPGQDTSKLYKVWGQFVYFDRHFRVGEFLHVLLTWGPDAPADNRVYANGKDVTDSSNRSAGPWDRAALDPGETFADLMSGVTQVRIGADSVTPNIFPDGSWPMDNTTLYRFALHDETQTPSDIKPRILQLSSDAFAVAGYSRKLVTGDTFTVTLRAEPGGKASFDLVQPASTSGGVTTPEKVRVSNVPMSEDPKAPGTYTGSHAVQYGQDVQDGKVVGHFTSIVGIDSEPATAPRPITVDTRVYLAIKPGSDLVPADRSSRSGLTIAAVDANGKAVRDHQLKLALSTTDEYTGILGGSSFEDAVGGSLDVDWGGVTDSFGEVTAQLVSGFAAKTMVVSAKDMVSGDVGVGWVRSYIEGAVEILVKPARTSALSFAGSMELSASREWLTADGRSRSRITAVVRDASGNPLSGHTVSFSLAGSNGSLRVIQSKTDSQGRAFADYIAGVRMGQVTIEVRDTTGGLFGSISIELRPDAPAKIALTAEPSEVFIGGEGSTVTAEVLDINDNPNSDVDVIYDIAAGEGSLSTPSVATDRNGKASVTFTPGNAPGTVTVKGTVTSRAPTPEEVSAAEGAVFLYGLPEDPGVLEVTGWLVEAGDEVVEGQDLVTLEDRRGTIYTVKSPRDGEVSVFAAEEGDEVEYGDTLGYVLKVEDK